MNGVNILEGKTLKDQLQTIKSVRERLAKVLKGVFFRLGIREKNEYQCRLDGEDQTLICGTGRAH